MAKGCYDKALELLGRRNHFLRELATKLRGRGYEESEVDEVLGRLTSLGYLNDHQAVEQFVRQRLARGPIGRRRLEADLQRRGAPEEAVREWLAELLPDDDRPAALAVAESHRHFPNKPQPLARFLERKGFSRRAIFFVLDEAKNRVEES